MAHPLQWPSTAQDKHGAPVRAALSQDLTATSVARGNANTSCWCLCCKVTLNSLCLAFLVAWFPSRNPAAALQAVSDFLLASIHWRRSIPLPAHSQAKTWLTCYDLTVHQGHDDGDEVAGPLNRMQDACVCLKHHAWMQTSPTFRKGVVQHPPVELLCTLKHLLGNCI